MPARQAAWAPRLSRARRASGHLGRGALVRWHLLSLDAPSIATLWTATIARGAGLRLPATLLAAMFLAVWMLYAGDRLLDAQPVLRAAAGLETAAELEPRHRFHQRHRRGFLAGLAVVTVGLVVLLPTLMPAELRLNLLLGALLGAYFLLIHLPLPQGMASARRLPKEIAVGVFFAAAVFIPTISRAPQLRWSLAPIAVIFAALCSLNCVAIYKWEHPDAPAFPGNATTPAHPLTRFAVRHVRRLTAGVLCAALVLATAAVREERWSFVAIALAAAALLLLDRARGRFAPITLRALGDLALATPLLVWPLLR